MECCGTGLRGAVKPLNRIPILCTASILYLFIIGRNLSTNQTLAAARTQAGEVWIGAAMECHMERHKDSALAPLLWLLLALCMLACAYPGYAVPGGYIIDYAASQY